MINCHVYISVIMCQVLYYIDNSLLGIDFFLKHGKKVILVRVSPLFFIWTPSCAIYKYMAKCVQKY